MPYTGVFLYQMCHNVNVITVPAIKASIDLSNISTINSELDAKCREGKCQHQTTF